MNYEAHYNTLIERAKTRLLEGYSEQHHVVPRCLGGSDDADNLVRLTPEEHYVAHQLLVKIHPGSRGLAYAAYMMGERKNNKAYGWVRRENSKTHSEFMKANPSQNAFKKGSLPWNAGNNISGFSGKIHTDATKELMSESMTGIKKGPMSEEHKNKIRIANTGTKQTEATRQLKSEIAKNLPPVTCPHCEKEGKKSAMVRWHFENCKEIA